MPDSKADENESQPDEGADVQPGPDEVFCVECGEVIKERAEICPECGVRQQSSVDEGQETTPEEPQDTGGTDSSLSQRRQYELEKIASNDKATIALIGFLISPVAYWMVGKKTLAIVNFLTFNFFLLGVFIVPIHCHSMVSNAEDELRRAGVGGY